MVLAALISIFVNSERTKASLSGAGFEHLTSLANRNLTNIIIRRTVYLGKKGGDPGYSDVVG